MGQSSKMVLSRALAGGAAIAAALLGSAGVAEAQPNVAPPAAPPAREPPAPPAAPPATPPPPPPKAPALGSGGDHVGATAQLDPRDYGGPAEPKAAGDGLIWVPRVLFFPVYLVTEYVLRVPLGALTTLVERHKVVETLKDIFVFGPHDNIGIVPTGIIDFGFRPSVGVYFFWDDFIADDNALRSHLATGGVDYLRATVSDRVKIDKQLTLKLRFEGVTRPDDVYFGAGPRALEATQSRYRETSFSGTIGFDAELKPGSGFEVYASLKTIRFAGDGYYSSDPSLDTLVEEGQLTYPDGFGGYTALRQGATASIDSRKPRPASGSGLRAEAYAEHDVDLRDPTNDRWVRWGGAVGGFLDITGKQRVLSLSLSTQFADPLGSAPVPFTELASLGGDNPMHGFLQGRLLDRSAVAATLEYRWPIWSFFDGSAQYAVGNVFGAHLSDLDPALFRMAFTVGIRSVGSRDHSFNIMVGSGTETFKDGAALNDFRFVFGATQGF